MTTTVTAPDLYPRRMWNWNGVKKYGARIRELTVMGLSAAIIAEEIGIKERSVCLIQRRLGLRRCRSRGEDN